MTRLNLNEKLKTKKVIIIDFDGTLINVKLDWKQLKEALFKEYPQKRFVRSKSLHGFISEYKEISNKNTKTFDKIISDLELKNLLDYSVNKNLFNYIVNNSTKVFVIYSTNSFKLISKILKEINVMKYFDLIISLESVSQIKPNMGGMNIIVSRYKHLPKRDFIFVGNSKEDKEVALRSNIEFLQISNGGVNE